MEQFDFEEDDQLDYNLFGEDAGATQGFDFSNGSSLENCHQNDENFYQEDEVAELEKTVAAEREELNELRAACEEVDQQIETFQGVIDKLGQKFSEMDGLLGTFAAVFESYEKMITNVSSDNDVIESTAKDTQIFVSTHAGQLVELAARTKETQERILNEAREFVALKKMTERRHIAEMEELDDEIKSLRPIVCDQEKKLSEENKQLAALEEELEKAQADLKEADKSVAEANRELQSLQEQVAALELHDNDETETLMNEIKIMEDKVGVEQAQLEAFSRGETQQHEFYAAIKQKIDTLLGEDAVFKRKIVAHQKEVEWNLETRMTELKQLNKELSDAMDSLNLARQKIYADRMDYDYMISKNEMDFEKLVASSEDELKGMNSVLTDFRRQVDELRDLKRQLAKLRENAQEKNEANSRKK